MITTVTLNAAVDKLYLVEQVTPKTVMRVKSVSNTAGGKGLNVARVASIAGEKVNAAGFIGGFAGQYIVDTLAKQNIANNFTEIATETRSCINVRDLSTGKHTEFLEPGAEVSADDLDRFFNDYCEAIKDSTVVAISGSTPKGTPVDFYSKLVTYAKEQGKKVILDTSGASLIECVKSCPTLVKPNTDEIAQIVGKEINTDEELLEAATKLHNDGVEIVVVSLGKDGALVVCNEGAYRSYTPDIPVVNTVGCGDSMVAGFSVGLSRGCDIVETTKMAMAMATANALTIETGSFTMESYNDIYGQIIVNKI